MKHAKVDVTFKFQIAQDLLSSLQRYMKAGFLLPTSRSVCYEYSITHENSQYAENKDAEF